jgi:outer membrane receptor protein involved in Fe transport
MKLPLPSLVCLATAVAFAPSVRAQRVETPPVPTKAEAAKAALDAERDKDKGVVVMNVFEVAAENDDEYRAANTTTGTRYNTPVKDLPMNIEVLTPAFLRDIGALDVRDALEYVSGIQLDNTTAANASRDNPENSTLLIRGISAGMKKDGFARFVPMDPITISRVDIIKGPGGALYGQNGTGGVVNSSSVLAGSRPVFRLGSTVGSYDFRRIEFLGSMSFGPNNRFGIALPMSYQENKSSAMYFETNTFVMNPAVTIKVGPKTQIMASIESRFNTRDNIRGFFLTDNTLAPNGTPYGSLIAGRPGTARVLTTPNQRDFRFEGPDTFRKERTYVRTYRIDHSFSDNLQWWGGFSEEDINVRDRSLSIALRNANDASIPLRVRNDPRYLALLRPSAGTAQPQVLDIRPNNVTNSARTVRPTWKSELYFAFDTGPVKHRMITGISYGPLRSGNNAPNQNFYYGNTGQATNPATVRLGECAGRRHARPLSQPDATTPRSSAGTIARSTSTRRVPSQRIGTTALLPHVALLGPQSLREPPEQLLQGPPPDDHRFLRHPQRPRWQCL